ncbi:MAG: cupredoxin domain-containing protein [Dehalococcoidales bacterium]
MTSRARAVVPALLLVASLVLAAGCTRQPEAPEVEEEPAADTATASAAGTFATGLEARSVSYNKSTVTVPAGALVTITFVNDDIVTHNFAVYETAAAANVIFRGAIIRPGTIDYRFNAPSEPGTYFFRCDIHPTFMTGDFVVTANASGGVTE